MVTRNETAEQQTSRHGKARAADRSKPSSDQPSRRSAGASTGETAGGRDRDATPSGANRHDRKSEVLTRHSASTVRSIADALVIKDGEPFFLCPPDGQIPISGDHGYGLYHHDTRFLNGYELQIAGVRANPLAAVATSGGEGALELTTPQIDLGAGRTIAKERLAVRWIRRLDGDRARLDDVIRFRNFDADGARLPIRLQLAAGFEDLFEVRGLLDEQRGALHDPRWDGDTLVFSYAGRDDVDRSLRVTFEPKPKAHDGPSCELEIDVPGRGEAEVRIHLEIVERVRPGAEPIERRTQREPGADGRRQRDASDRRPGGATDGSDRNHHECARENDADGWPVSVSSDSITLDGALRRSLADLLTLRGELNGHAYYAAGVPWFSTLFGRDSLIAAYQTLAFDPRIAAETLRLLAAMQGAKDDDWRDEQPGKILHELRIGELARLHEIPHTPYYGSIDSTPLFLVVLARHAAWTGSLDLFHELGDNIERALAWIDGPGDPGGTGYVAYDSAVDHGLVNQGWKDSGDGIVDSDGGMPKPPIALPEVQGYVYAAKRELADLFERAGDGDRAAQLRHEADELQERFERDFWSDDLGCYVLAVGAEGPCRVVSSNAGQVLWSGIATPAHARAVADRLLRDDVFGGWGIRTLSSKATSFNPIGYHLGTVWPHDNGLIAEGFRRYGLDEAAERIGVGLVEASTDFPQQRLPECFAGYARDEFGIPVRYPVACHPQAWAAGAVPHLVTTILGLVPDGFNRRLLVSRPRLPRFMRHLELGGLSVAGASVDLVFDRADGHAKTTIERVDGDLEVRIDDDSPPREDGRRR